MAKAKRPTPADRPFLNRREAAALLGLNVQLIDEMIRRERLPAYRPAGRRVLIRRDELLRAVADSPVWKGAPRGER